MLTYGTVLREKGGSPLPRRKPWVSLGGARPFTELAMAAKPMGRTCKVHAWVGGKCADCDRWMIGTQERNEQNFWHKVRKGPSCWSWEGYVGSDGRPVMQWRGVPRHATYAAWDIFTGKPLTDGMTLDHLCRNGQCVNPEHLEEVTLSENLRRYHATSKCKRGHNMSETRRIFATHSRCGVCYDEKLAAQRLSRHARGLKKPGRKSRVAQ